MDIQTVNREISELNQKNEERREKILQKNQHRYQKGLKKVLKQIDKAQKKTIKDKIKAHGVINYPLKMQIEIDGKIHCDDLRCLECPKYLQENLTPILEERGYRSIKIHTRIVSGSIFIFPVTTLTYTIGEN